MPLSFTKKTHWSRLPGQVHKGCDFAPLLFLARESALLGFLLFSVTQPKNHIPVAHHFLNRVVAVIELMAFFVTTFPAKMFGSPTWPAWPLCQDFGPCEVASCGGSQPSSVSVMKIHAVAEVLIVILSFMCVFQEKSASSNARLKTNKEIPGLVHQPRAK